MEKDRELADRAVAGTRRLRVLLVEGDLGRRATLTVALGTCYRVEPAATAQAAQIRAALNPFDLAVLDAAVLEASLPRLVRLLRARSRAVRLVIVAGRRDLRG